jgi:hypothetical protein
MSVQFTIRGNDILRLNEDLLRFQHPEREKRWIIFLEVTPSIASFRFGETTVQFPVDGKSPGYASFSEEMFQNATTDFPQRNPPREISAEIRYGRIWCGDGHANGEIEVGYFRDPHTGRPLYLSDAELSVLGDLLTDTVVQGVDLKPHIAEARESISSNISFAYGHLQHCGFGYEEVKELAEARILGAASRLRAQFGTLGVTTWKS